MAACIRLFVYPLIHSIVVPEGLPCVLGPHRSTVIGVSTDPTKKGRQTEKAVCHCAIPESPFTMS